MIFKVAGRRPGGLVAGLAAAVIGLVAVLGAGAVWIRGDTTGPSETRSSGWSVTIYYTAVERLHSGPSMNVTGCAELDCAGDDTPLGSYLASFVSAVRDEGTGLTRSGRYLNWSHDIGFWLDDVPRDASGAALRPFASAAADPDVLARGTRFSISDCGRDRQGGALPAAVCERIRAARWTITDEFTPGLGGAQRLDLYIGEQTSVDFTNNDLYVALYDATVEIQAAPA